MRKILLALIAVALIGCAEKPESLAEPPAEEQETTQAAPTGDSIGIVSPAAGAITPVTNAGSIGGGGGGVNQAAKSQAKKAAERASGPDLSEYLDD